MKFIDIRYVIDQKSLTEKFDVDMKFVNFMNYMEIIHEVDLSMYEVYYLNSKLGLKYYKFPIREIIRIDEEPIFYFYKIKDFMERRSSPLNYSTIRSLVNESDNFSKGLVKSNENSIIKDKVNKDTNNKTNKKDEEKTKSPAVNKGEIADNLNDKSNKTSKVNFKKEEKNANATLQTLPSHSFIASKKVDRDERIKIIVSNIDNEKFKAHFSKQLDKVPITFETDGRNFVGKFKDLNSALNCFSSLSNIKKQSSEINCVGLKLKFENNQKSCSWKNTNFYNSLTTREAEYRVKMLNLNSLPSIIPTNKKVRNLRKSSDSNISNVLFKSANDSSFVSGNISILKAKGKHNF